MHTAPTGDAHDGARPVARDGPRLIARGMPEEKTEETRKKKDRPDPVERTVVSDHTITLGGETIAYTATAGTIFLRDEEDEPRAEVFYVAYTRNVDDASARPVTFAFNGGPGSSAVWLHLGALGPKRVEASDALPSPPPPYRLIDNDASILDVTDLVFIDPVGTGWSRPLGETKPTEFHGVKPDVESVAEVIQRWTSRNGRWNSARYIAGESYGTTRAAALAAHLSQLGMMVNGLLLISPALMFQTFIFELGNDLPYVLYLPGYAAAAAYHGKLASAPEELSAFLREVETFAVEEYAPALLLGAALPSDRRERLAGRLAELTGLQASLFIRHDLRVDLSRFCRELRRDEGKIIGRLDARFVGMLANERDDPGEHDPALYYPYGPYASAIHHYLRSDLGYTEERRYEVLSFTVNESWKWAEEGGAQRLGFINVVADLRRAMVQNPHLRVIFASGIFDLATPYFASMHTARHLGREPSIQEQVSEVFYDAGHMMYLHEPSRQKLREDLAGFLSGRE